VHAFDMLGDPVRRRILELLADGEMTSGAVCAVIQAEFGISQPAVSQHLKVLREGGFATVRPEGTLDRFRRFWTPPLEALATELARGRRERRLRGPGDTTQEGTTP
jgi:DNA-binding transcriptional ArsR family regulator